MQNNERPALYVNPKLALQATQELKAICSEEQKVVLQDAFGVLTERDLLFYSLGRSVGLREAEVLFCSTFGYLPEQEEGK